MDLEQDYLEYVIQFSLSLFAISAASFIDPTNPITLGTLIIVPMLFGYNAYISRNQFKYSSFLGFISLMFVPLGPIMAAVAITVSVGNLLVSFFAGGTNFKDYYGATMLPLLITGLILGSTLYGAASYQPSFGDEIRTGIADTAETQTSTILEETNLVKNIVGGQQEAATQMAKQVSTTTVVATEAYILNQTEANLSAQEQIAIQQAFSSAREDIPNTILRSSEEMELENQNLGVSGAISEGIENLLVGDRIIIVVPLVTFGMYGLQPLVGLLTAIFAKLTQTVSRPKESESSFSQS